MHTELYLVLSEHFVIEDAGKYKKTALVIAFAEENLLKLNVSKYEIVLFSRDRNIIPHLIYVFVSVTHR